MEKDIKEILNRIKKINRKINKSKFSKKEDSNKKIFKKTLFILEKILNYFERNNADIENKN